MRGKAMSRGWMLQNQAHDITKRATCQYSGVSGLAGTRLDRPALGKACFLLQRRLDHFRIEACVELDVPRVAQLHAVLAHDSDLVRMHDRKVCIFAEENDVASAVFEQRAADAVG